LIVFIAFHPVPTIITGNNYRAPCPKTEYFSSKSGLNFLRVEKQFPLSCLKDINSLKIPCAYFLFSYLFVPQSSHINIDFKMNSGWLSGLSGLFGFSGFFGL
jgi:hypothetical protein